ncbi:MAG: hypothetical protein IPK77_13115 [Cellvibrio sp.]|nr:hypothetical protein [Cellvibrio sp.]
MKEFFRKNYNCPSCEGLVSSSVWSSVSTCKSCGVSLIEESIDDRSKVRKIVEAVIVIVFPFSIIGKEFLVDIHPFLPIAASILFAVVIIGDLFTSKSKLKINYAFAQNEIFSIQEKISDLNRFLNRKIGAVDFLMQDSEIRKKSGLEGSLSHILKIHNERIGGLSVEEQHEAILRINPHLNLMQLVSEEVEKAEAKINQLKSFMAEKL